MDSPFVHRFQTAKNKYIYDVNTNHVVQVDDVVYDIIKDYGVLPLESIITKYENRHDPDRIKEIYKSIALANQKEGLFSNFRPKEIKYPKERDAIRLQLDSKLHQLTLEVTEQCNLRCRYCIFSENYLMTRSYTSRKMTFEVARKAIDLFLDHSMLSNDITISFYGGEPLLNKPLIQDCVSYVNANDSNQHVRFHITTNGTLIDDEMIQLFIENDFALCISLDGPKEIHNRNRVYRNNRGSYDKIVENLQKIKKLNPRFYQNLSFNMVISPPYDLLAHYDFVRNSELIPTGELVKPLKIASSNTLYFEQFTPDELKLKGEDELRKLYRSAAIENCLNSPFPQRDLEFLQSYLNRDMTTIYQRPSRERLSETFHPGGTCVPGSKKLFVTVDGRLFVCEKCCTTTDNLCIGSVTDGIDYDKVVDLIDEYSNLCPEDCLNCWAAAFCEICFVVAEDGTNGMRAEKKRIACANVRKRSHEGLIFCYSILEENPRAFDFIRKFESEDE